MKYCLASAKAGKGKRFAVECFQSAVNRFCNMGGQIGNKWSLFYVFGILSYPKYCLPAKALQTRSRCQRDIWISPWIFTPGTLKPISLLIKASFYKNFTGRSTRKSTFSLRRVFVFRLFIVVTSPSYKKKHNFIDKCLRKTVSGRSMNKVRYLW